MGGQVTIRLGKIGRRILLHEDEFIRYHAVGHSAVRSLRMPMTHPLLFLVAPFLLFAAAHCGAAQDAGNPEPSTPTRHALTAGNSDHQSDSKAPESKIKPGLFAALSARGIGPAMTSGRIGDFAIHPSNPSEIYAAVASGGVWKSSNSGTTWSPIFDSYGSFSVGCLALDPNNPHTLWVGTGENNSQRSVAFGDGVYLSRDGGKSFTNMGLKDSEHIGMIRVDPGDSNIVYVAAQGPLWKSGGERGLYKTADGGKTWERLLHVDDETGINEVHLDPRDSDVLYASAYQRRRHVWTLVNGGPGSGVHKSVDGGRTWRKLTSGLPGTDKGRIGLGIPPTNPDMIYAIVEAAEGEGGVFRSTNRGETWEKRSGYMTSSPQYYNEIVCDPKDPEKVYFLDTFLSVSDDGGKTIRRVPQESIHVDYHALWVDPNNTDRLIVGNDGGIYDTFDAGRNWRFVPNLPATQFYRVGVDNSRPFYFVYGGTQDNNTVGGPSQSFDRAGIRNEDWFVTVGGDGFETVVDPVDPNIVYSESQDGGLIRYDRRSGEAVDIRPRERPGEAPEVFNWDCPLILSPHKHSRLYFAGRRLHKSEDYGNTWTTVSGDLTRGIDRNTLKVFGKIVPPDAPSKHLSTSIFGNAVAISESPKIAGLIYVGTDDGLLHVTEDGGTTWRKIENFPVVPEMTYVSCVLASMHSADTVYASFNNHKMGDFRPYILRSDDRGRTWRAMAGDLSPRDVVHCLAEDHVDSRLLFCGTEFGAYFSLDAGEKWLKVFGLPTIAVRDIEIQRRESDLVLATFGRGFYIVDDYSPLRVVSEELLNQDCVIFPIKEALSYVRENRLSGNSGRGWQGATYYAAKNPPFGAVFTYYLKDKLKTKKELRKEAEKKDDWKYPTIDDFRAEDREQDPQVVFTIRDKGGEMVRQFSGPRGDGMHRVAWDLRYPSARPISLSAGELAPWDEPTTGPMAPAGAYSVTISKVVGGETTVLAGPREFNVSALDRATFATKGESAREKFEFQRNAQRLQRAVSAAGAKLDEAQSRLPYLRKAIAETPGLKDDLAPALDSLRVKLLDLEARLRGDPTLSKRAEPQTPDISDRASTAVETTLGNTQPPTTTAREQYDLAAGAFEGVLAELRRVIEVDLAAIERKLEAAGAPYTPGRMPEWTK